jgi:hypothetical protein
MGGLVSEAGPRSVTLVKHACVWRGVADQNRNEEAN